MGSIRAKSVGRRLEFTLFNMGALALSICISGQVFFRLLGYGPLFNGPDVSLREIMLPMCMMTLVHYLCNSGSVAIIIALDLRKSIYQVWAKNFRWTCITYFTGATVAALIGVNARAVSPSVLGATIPIILITYFANNTYKQKVEEHIESLKELSKLYLRTVESLALAVDAKDQTTYGHIRRVRAYSLGLARLRGISDANELLAIETGSLLHDIGKLAVDDYILNKPGRLSREEFDKVKVHTIAGEEILNQVEFPYPVAQIVRGHHERWDGTGYPDGLKGEGIPLGARILIIADTFDAIRSSRPYKVARGIQECVQELRDGVGSTYDPDLAELFIKNVDRLVAEATEAVTNMRELSFHMHSGKSDSGVRPTKPCASAPAPAPPSEVTAELVSLSEFCINLGKHLCLSDLLLNLECRLRRLLPFSTCAFFLDNGDGALRVVHAGGKLADKLQNLRIGLGRGISGWVAAYGHPMINSRAALEFQNLQGDFNCLTQALVAPLNVDGICLGTISLYNEAPVSFTDDHLRILQMAANQAAPVLAETRRRIHSSSEQELVDPVTKAYRSRYLAFAGRELIASCLKSSSDFSLVFLDLPNLPEIVELHGSHTGDAVLRKVAETLKTETRERDVLVRMGQNGFVVLLEGVTWGQVSRRTQQIRQRISDIRVSHIACIACRIGAASYPENGTTIFTLLDNAYRALESHPQTQEAGIEPEEGKILEFPA